MATSVLPSPVFISAIALFVQDHAADQLDVKRSQAEHAARGFAGNGEGRDQQVVERLAVGQLLAELDGLGSQRFVGERLGLRLQRVDRIDLGLVGPRHGDRSMSRRFCGRCRRD